MKIDVKRLAKLTHLRVSAEQEEKYATQMQDILEMVEKLPQIESTASLVDPNNPMTLRKDIPTEPYKRDVILQNAPQTQAGCVVVPKVMD